MRSDIGALCLEHRIRPNPSQLAFHHTKLKETTANHDASAGKFRSVCQHGLLQELDQDGEERILIGKPVYGAGCLHFILQESPHES